MYRVSSGYRSFRDLVEILSGYNKIHKPLCEVIGYDTVAIVVSERWVVCMQYCRIGVVQEEWLVEQVPSEKASFEFDIAKVGFKGEVVDVTLEIFDGPGNDGYQVVGLLIHAFRTKCQSSSGRVCRTRRIVTKDAGIFVM